MGLFTRRLVSDKKPQNLVGWRYTEFAHKIDDKTKRHYLRAVADLIDETEPLSARVTHFQAILEGVAESAGTNHGPAMLRSTNRLAMT